MKLYFILCIGALLIAPIIGQLLSSIKPVEKKYYLITWGKVNWFKAFAHCRSMDMNLVSITTREENDRILKQITDEGHLDKDFWTSGTKLGDNNVYQWMSIGKPVTFTDWAPTQPDNSWRDGQHASCIHIVGLGWGKGTRSKWNDEFCNEELYFICEQYLVQYDHCDSSN